MNHSGDARLDDGGVRTSFDRASGAYEKSAVLQARVGDELLQRLDFFKLSPGVVVDLGSGTGRITGELKRRYRRAQVVALDIAPGMLREARKHMSFFRRFERVCADVRQLPFADASVDIAVSNVMLQWCDNLDSAFRVAAKFVISSQSVVKVSRKRPQPRRRCVFLPLVVGPSSFVDPVPLFADTKIKVAIKLPMPLRLFTNLKSRTRALRPELIGRPDFKVRRYEWLCGHRYYCVDPSGTATIAVGFNGSGFLRLPSG